VYYYTLIDSYWSRQSKLLAKDGVAGDNFGYSVSINRNNALIGAGLDDDKGTDAGMLVRALISKLTYLSICYTCEGSAYCYTLTGSHWSRQSKLLATDGVAGNYYGISVSLQISNALIGSYGDDIKGSNAGTCLYVYTNICIMLKYLLRFCILL
jgi:hypothetical protein